MCIFCGGPTGKGEITSADHALELLALLECPGALSPEEALRLGTKLLAWCGGSASPLRCESVPSEAVRYPDAIQERHA